MKYCSNCNIHFSTDGNFCEKCGNWLADVTPAFCTECGEKLQEGAMFCGECGARINVPCADVKAAPPGTKSSGSVTIEPASSVQKFLKKKTVPKEALIAAVVLVIALLGGGGYYFLTHHDKAASKAMPKTGITNTIKNGDNNTASSKGIAGNTGNAAQAQPFRPGAVAGAYHSSADKEGSYVHSAALTVDGNPASCWSEGVPGLGIGENIVIHFNGTYKVSGMNIWIGHQKSQSLYYQNARPGIIRVEGSDGSSEVYALQDTFGAQRIDFKIPINTKFIRIIVEQSVQGNKYQDTCIAEVSFF